MGIRALARMLPAGYRAGLGPIQETGAGIHRYQAKAMVHPRFSAGAVRGL